MKRPQDETSSSIKRVRVEVRNPKRLLQASLDVVVRQAHFPILRSLVEDLVMPKSIYCRCLEEDSFAKDYVSYLAAALPPSEDDRLINIVSYCLDTDRTIDVEETLCYPRSEKFLLFLYETAMKEIPRSYTPQYNIYQNTCGCISDTVGCLQKRYTRHAGVQIKKYIYTDPTILRYKLQDMPVSEEFVEFLKLALVDVGEQFIHYGKDDNWEEKDEDDEKDETYDQCDVFEKGLFKYVCKHLELIEELLPLFNSNLGKLLLEFGLDYQNTYLSVKLLLGYDANPYVRRILVNREWDPKKLFEISSQVPRDILNQIVFHKLNTKTDGWEIFPQFVNLKYLAGLNMDDEFFRRCAQSWKRLDIFWDTTNLNLLDKLKDKACWKKVNWRMFRSTANWKWVENYKSIWENKNLKEFLICYIHI
jgi:hypothetical protein